MSPLWKKLSQQQKPNHHFPELTAGYDFRRKFWHLTATKSGLLLILAFNLLAGFFYLTQTNAAVTASYQTKDLSQQLAQLQSDNKRLNLDYIQLQSMDKIAASVKTLNLVPIDNSEVINLNGGAVAFNNN